MSEGDDILSFRRIERASEPMDAAASRGSSSTTNRPADLSNEQGEGEHVLSMVNHIDASDSETGHSETSDSETDHRGTNHGEAEPFRWRDLQHGPAAVPVQIRLGATRLVASVQQTTEPGAIIALDARVDDPVEIVVSGQVIAYGRLVVAHNKLAIEVCRVDKEIRRRVA